MKYSGFGLAVLVLSSAALLHAGEADVNGVEVRQIAKRVYDLQVTVRHADDGWNHYADKWEVVGPNGTVLGTRTLLHPHVTEQPFTRTLSGVKLSAETKRVTIRAHDSVHEYGGATLTVDLPVTLAQ